MNAAMSQRHDIRWIVLRRFILDCSFYLLKRRISKLSEDLEGSFDYSYHSRIQVGHRRMLI